MRDAEYDHFGPWILKITKEDPLPPLFVPHIPANTKALLSIKIPRGIDRRDAAPGWNLYDYVINMYEQYFQIWIRVDESVETVSFNYEDIICIVNSEILLSGKLKIVTGDETFSFSYSTVSSDIIREAVEIIRERYNRGCADSPVPEYNCLHEAELDFYFDRLKKQELRDNPENRLLFCQKRENLGKLEENIIKKLFYRIGSVALLESLHFCDGKELKIIGRDRAFNNIFYPVYGKETVWLPVKQLKDIEIIEYDKKVYSSVKIKTENSELEYYASTDNISFATYEKSLKMFT